MTNDAATMTPHAPATNQARQIDSPYLNADEAAAYCRVAKKTIYNQRRYIERMPGVGKLLFRREALDKWLATRRRA